MFSIPESQFILTQGVPCLYRSPPGMVPALFRHSHGPALPLRKQKWLHPSHRHCSGMQVISFRWFRGRYSQVKGAKFTLFHLRHLKISPCLGIWLSRSIFIKWSWQQRKAKHSSGGYVHILNLASKCNSM